jgi:hypothetical protein
MAGMQITTSTSGELPVSTLVGTLADQSALSGVLQTLSDLQLPVLSVERLDRLD